MEDAYLLKERQRRKDARGGGERERERERAEGSAMIRKEKEESLGKIPYYEFICLNLGVLSSDYYG